MLKFIINTKKMLPKNIKNMVGYHHMSGCYTKIHDFCISMQQICKNFQTHWVQTLDGNISKRLATLFWLVHEVQGRSQDIQSGLSLHFVNFDIALLSELWCWEWKYQIMLVLIFATSDKYYTNNKLSLLSLQRTIIPKHYSNLTLLAA